MLVNLATIEQIKDTLFKLLLSKTPGPDGLTAEFFRASWEALGSEVDCAVKQFFSSAFLSKFRLNHICVLNKTENKASSSVRSKL